MFRSIWLLQTCLYILASSAFTEDAETMSWSAYGFALERQQLALNSYYSLELEDSEVYEQFDPSEQAFAPTPVVANIPDYELSALFDLYNATDGVNWRWHNLTAGIIWDFTADANPCKDKWEGITCTITTGPPDNLRYIEKIDVSNHWLNGYLPDSLGNLSHLTVLTMFHNRINGTIPSALGKLSQLIHIDLSKNFLTRNLPESFYNLTNMQDFLVGANRLTGSISSVIQYYTNLTHLGLAENYLNGSIPDIIGNFPQLHFLDLSNNFLTGPIPESFGQLTNLNFVWLSNNSLSGPLPLSITNFHIVKYFYMNDNQLSGPIPPNIGNLSEITFFDMDANHFTGTIPPSFANLKKLFFFGGRTNHFRGTIPDFFTTFTRMHYLYLYENTFTGTIPAAIGNLKEMLFLYLHKNQFRGAIPESIGNLTQLQSLYVYDNQLTGTIPASLGRLQGLQYLYLQSNALSGTVPRSLSQLSSLVSILLEDNKLIGTLDGLFDPVNQTQLTTITLSDNQFTGELPDEIFLLPELSTFVAVSNCFRGSLRPVICNGTKLIALALDGLQSASSCRVELLPGVSTSYLSDNSLKGRVPTCLFQMPKLNTLHLSGNGLTGSLPADLVINDMLIDLSLSHNVLTGTIPSAIQQRQWYNLDLSYNRFTGSLLAGTDTVKVNFTYSLRISPQEANLNFTKAASSSALTLINNRLSGSIPGALLPLLNISVLNGNLFSCKFDKSNLPSHDDGRTAYDCASNSFAVPYYFWLSLSGFVLLVLVFLFTRNRTWQQCLGIPNIRELYAKWMDAVRAVESIVPNEITGQKVQAESVVLACAIYTSILRITLTCTMYILLVLLPLYTGLSMYYGTHLHQYAWTVSAAFSSGRAPFALMFLFLFFFMCLLVVAYRQFTHQFMRIEKVINSKLTGGVQDQQQSEAVTITTASVKNKVMSEVFTVHAVFVIVNFTIVLGVNIGFVYVALYQSTALMVVSQVLLSFFKIVWNSVCSRYIIRWIVYHCAPSTRAQSDATIEYFPIQLIVALFNNIAIPCLVVTVISPNCFYNLFVAAEAVSSRYDYAKCQAQTFQRCIVYLPQLASTSYNPPFTYSYQCSSSFITYYAPAYMYLCITVAFLNPTLLFLIAYFHKRATPGSWWHTCLDSVLPRIWKPVRFDPAIANHPRLSHAARRTDGGEGVTTLSSLTEITSISSAYPSIYAADDEGQDPDDVDGPGRSTVDKKADCESGAGIGGSASDHLSRGRTNVSSLTSRTNRPLTPAQRSLFQSYFDANLVLITLLTLLGILLTFGALFPPLGAAVALTICSVVYISKLKIGRFITQAVDQNLLAYVSIIDAECRSIGSTKIVFDSVWLLVLFSCWFYSLFLFDTLGDAVGFRSAFWVLLIMGLMPFGFYGVYHHRALFRTAQRNLLARRIRSESASASSGVNDVNSVEMRQTTISSRSFGRRTEDSGSAEGLQPQFDPHDEHTTMNVLVSHQNF